MDKKRKENQSSLRVRIHTWWSNLKRTRKDNLQNDNKYKKRKTKIKNSKSGIGAQIESMRRTN